MKYDLKVIEENDKNLLTITEDAHATTYDLTDLEIAHVINSLKILIKKLEKHKGYYDDTSQVYIIRTKKRIEDTVIRLFRVKDTVKDIDIMCYDEESAKHTVDLLRESYRK